MTPEQLDETEKLAEAWIRHEHFSDAPPLAKRVLPLVKALREAWARCETLRELADEKAYEAGLYARRMEEAQKARSESRAEVERLKESVSNLDALYVSRTDELRESEAEVERLRDERDEARKWLEGICVEFESTIAHAEWRAAGSKGMSVPFFGDFADAARHPGMIGRMGWWVRQFRAALKEGDR